MDQTLVGWAVSAFLLLLTGTLTFLARNAFDSVQQGLSGVVAEVRTMRTEMATGTTRVVSLETEARTELSHVKDRIERLERDLRDLSRGMVQ